MSWLRSVRDGGVAFITRIETNLDKIFAFFGLLLGLFISLLPLMRTGSGPIAIIFGAVLIILSATYLFTRPARFDATNRELGLSGLLVMNILFFLVLGFCLLTLYLRPETYVRPIPFFVGVFGLIAILTVEIMLLPAGFRLSGLVLFKVIIIPLMVIWSQMLLYPTVIGGDSAFHQAFTQQMLATGAVPEGWGYFNFPVMHMNAGVASLLTGMNYKLSSVFSITFLVVFCVEASVFLLGRLILNAKVGLMAALLLGTVSCFIYLSYWTVPFSFGAIFLIMSIFLLFKRATVGNKLVYSILAAGFIIMANISHQFVALCTVIVLGVLWLGSGFGNNEIGSQSRTRVVSGSLLVLGIASLFGWWWYSGDLALFIRLARENFSMGLLNSLQLSMPDVETYLRKIPDLVLIFNNIGKIVISAIAVFGGFFMISRHMRGSYAFHLALSALIILGVAFFGVINYGVLDILFYRWEYYSQILLAVPLAVAAFLLVNYWQNWFMKTVTMVLGVVFFSFLAVMNTSGNIDRPLTPGIANVRQTYTVAELQALETVLNSSAQVVSIDATAATMNPFVDRDSRVRSIRDNTAFFTKDFSAYRGTIIMIRHVMSTSSVPLATFVVQLSYDPAELLGDEGYSRIYTNGTVTAFYALPNS